MVNAVKAGKADEFLGAAGVLAHYVGDACQPLHISYLYDGDPEQTRFLQVRQFNGSWKTQPVSLGTGVHDSYESVMVEHHMPEIVDALNQLSTPGDGAGPRLVTGGHAAAVAVVALMQQTFDLMSPSDIVNTFVKLMAGQINGYWATDQASAMRQAGAPQAVYEALWTTYGDRTKTTIGNGCRCLAMLWESAWVEGGGDVTLANAGVVDPQSLKALYLRPDFVPSVVLDQIAGHFQSSAAPV
jgi:hypothetical protein